MGGNAFPGDVDDYKQIGNATRPKTRFATKLRSVQNDKIAIFAELSGSRLFQGWLKLALMLTTPSVVLAFPRGLCYLNSQNY
ncbi:MAG: hypothetical protein C4567_04785 [Deltaproteobacteria bacterium]|nr:MAG: hypothetical protein C4567_04785 [Deltaproteobacteria bacterium]